MGTLAKCSYNIFLFAGFIPWQWEFHSVALADHLSAFISSFLELLNESVERTSTVSPICFWEEVTLLLFWRKRLCITGEIVRFTFLPIFSICLQITGFSQMPPSVSLMNLQMEGYRTRTHKRNSVGFIAFSLVMSDSSQKTKSSIDSIYYF